MGPLSGAIGTATIAGLGPMCQSGGVDGGRALAARIVAIARFQIGSEPVTLPAGDGRR
jgi:hypothetical protein